MKLKESRLLLLRVIEVIVFISCTLSINADELLSGPQECLYSLRNAQPLIFVRGREFQPHGFKFHSYISTRVPRPGETGYSPAARLRYKGLALKEMATERYGRSTEIKLPADMSNWDSPTPRGINKCHEFFTALVRCRPNFAFPKLCS